MKANKLPVILILCIAVSTGLLSQATGQTLSPNVLSSSGGFYSSGGNTLSFTLGEPVHQTFSSGNVMLTQGEQQPYLMIKVVNIRAFIQGFYRGSGMQLAVIDPVTHPLLCDTVVLRMADAGNPDLIVEQDTAVIATDGSATFNIAAKEDGKRFYFILIHRNSLETWSASPVTLRSGLLYNFNTSASQAYGNNMADMGDGNFALWSGDVDQDGVIDQNDLGLLETATQNFTSGYYSTDITGDHVVESVDFSLIENNTLLNLSRTRP